MLNLFTARADTDLLDLCLDRIGADLENIHTGKSAARQVVLIVPAQFTLEAEEAAFRKFDAKGFFDFHVMSGARLNLQILKETGSPGTEPVNTLGRCMLLRRIALQHKEELKAFGSVCDSSEFLKMAGDFIVQMKQNQVRTEDLEAMRSAAPQESLLAKKLADMQILAAGYEKAMAGKFNDSEDMLRFVTGQMSGSHTVKESIFWYYGFYSFTRRELEFMRALMKNSCGLNVALTMGRSADPDASLFAAPGRAAAALQQIAREEGEEAPLLAASGANLRTLPPELAHLEKNLYAIPPAVFEGDPSHISLVRCSGPFTQAETIAARILTLVREKGIRYDEMAILTEDMAGQGAVIRRVCQQMGVPLFADEKRAVGYSPAIETIAALLRFAAGSRYASDMTACLKPGLLSVPAAENETDLEQFENYCKQYHIRDDRFFQPFRYGEKTFGADGMAKLEAIRSQLADLFVPFLASLEDAETVREKSSVLRGFLAEDLRMPEKLEESALELAEAQMLDAAEEQQQIWDIFCGLLDQCVELLGDDGMTLPEYASLLTDSFNDIKVGLLPQAQGKVLLGTLSRSLTGRCKALFLAGVNDGILPKEASSEAILTQRELEELKEKGFTLAKTDSVLREENEIGIYTAFTLPSDLLWIGWCASGADGKELKPSLLISRLRTMFPALPEEQDVESADEPLAFIQGRKAAASRIAAAMREPLAEGSLPDALWKEVYDQLDDTDAVRAGLLFTNREEPLPPEKAKELYAYEEYSLSPSRLEQFAHCPFRHFVNYGLRPQEPEDFEISPLALGNVHHACLQRISEWLSEPSRTSGRAITDPSSRWMTVTDEELAEKMKEIIAQVQAEENEGVMQAGPKEAYQAGRIAEVCTRFARMMVLQVRKGRIAEMRFEAEFKRGKELPPVRVETPQGTVYLEGKIDRLDLLEGSLGRYAKVVDYKSGDVRFDPQMAENGLMLQLSIYLEAALGKGDARPAGVFYYHIDEPEAGAEAADLAADGLSEDVWAKMQAACKMRGFYVDSPDVIRAIDAEVGPGDDSTVFNYRMKKDGTTASNKNAVSEEAFEDFRRNFRASLTDLCTRLTEGDTEIAPRKLKNGTACKWCEFRGICAFDTAFEGNRYH